MYRILPLTPKLHAKVIKYNLSKKFAKSVILLSENPYHPGLHTELLEPKSSQLHSFRIDKKFRGIYIIHSDMTTIQVVGVTVHYH